MQRPAIKHSAPKIYRYPAVIETSFSTVTLGNFDGVHIGHQAVFRHMNNSSTEGASVVVVSFYPHPLELLRNIKVPALSSLRKKIHLLQAGGVDALYLIRFTKEISQMRASEFVDEILVKKLKLSKLVVGEDARIGAGREGSPEVIEKICLDREIQFEQFPFFLHEGVRPSSRQIRSLIERGEVGSVEPYLGRKYSLEGKIVSGDGRGAAIGFPTVNLNITSQAIPCNGVYACRAIVKGSIYKAATNVGVQPTFGGEKRRVEAFLLDYDGPALYGERIELEFVERVRAETKFESVEELTKQIASDVLETRDLVCLEN